MIRRIIQFDNLLTHRSIFLFGPRQVGKSTFLKAQYPEAKFYNLLQADTFKELTARPELIRRSLTEEDNLIVIDEIQKLPSLLDEVQGMMTDRPSLRFILTGSSARKLKRGGANLLAGRALLQRLHPLVYPEIREIDLLQRINRGNLPAILNSPVYSEDLTSYVGTYLKEEIAEEGLSRGIEDFSRFLEVAALTNGKQINYTEVGSDTGVPPRTIREYYQILEDTYLGWTLPAFQKTVKRKPVSTGKFYFFDLGVVNSLLKRGQIQFASELYGEALEHLIFLELKAFLDYSRYNVELTYWRSLSQLEVDFVLGDVIGIEVKSKSRVAKRDYKNLLALREEFPKMRTIVVSNESQPWRTEEGVEVMPAAFFLQKLWGGGIL
jgi:predicted AAA+ superfamily ATPase